MKNKEKEVKAVIEQLNKEYAESSDNITKPKKATKHKASWEDNVADRLKQWSLKPDSYQLEAFFLHEDLDDSTFYAGIARHEKLAKAHRFAMTSCGINRENLAIKRGENVNTTNSSMLYQYLDRFKAKKEHDEAREDKKIAGVKEALGNITIIDHMLEKE